MRSSKDLARRLRFDRFPRPDAFQRWYPIAAALAVVAAIVGWLFIRLGWHERQYLPGPVAPAHATFGDRCQRCHSSFRNVADRACVECHVARAHSEYELEAPRCAACHVEHRSDAVSLAVSNRLCIDCHGALESKRQPKPSIQTSIRDFAEHPQFAALREGAVDRAVLRFNHKLHLNSDRIAKEDTLSCPKCHVPEADGRLMKPINFEAHCKRCHEQKPPLDVGPIEAPHKEPAVVRESIAAQLLVLAVQSPEVIFTGRKSTLPGVPDREPISEARSLRAFQTEWLGKVEERLYKPLNQQAPLLEGNKYCFLCHDSDLDSSPGGLPKIRASAIPKRWLLRGEFSHRRHDSVECSACHDQIRSSERSSDVNLPKRELCQRCHSNVQSRSAGTQCVLCHSYHDTSRHVDPGAPARQVNLGVLLGDAEK
ncbi:MAG: hypothetical protein HY270_02400 [Deltaproteobacteria bacterium]|nr:hypothetical protein [Deltaproteobacteria bacterium]